LITPEDGAVSLFSSSPSAVVHRIDWPLSPLSYDRNSILMPRLEKSVRGPSRTAGRPDVGVLPRLSFLRRK